MVEDIKLQEEFPKLLSAPRFKTYQDFASGDDQRALRIYQWNLELCAAFYMPLHICEISIRNGVVQALESQFGADWHTSIGFQRTLPESKGYNPKQDLILTRAKLERHAVLSAGKVVAELKFVFWEYMFTARHDNHLWKPYFQQSFPNAADLPAGRNDIRHRIELVRRLRNRIAHHEPIFRRDLMRDYKGIIDLIAWRSSSVARWVEDNQRVTAVLNEKPK